MNVHRSLNTTLTFVAALAAPLCLANPEYTVVGTGRSDIVVERQGAEVFILDTRPHGPQWTPANAAMLQGMPEAQGDLRVYEDTFVFTSGRGRSQKTIGPKLAFKQVVKQTSADTFGIAIELTPDTDMQLGLPERGATDKGTVAVVLLPSQVLKGGEITLRGPGGEISLGLPAPQGSNERISLVLIKAPDGRQFQMAFDPAVFVHRDQDEARFMMTSDETVAANETFKQQVFVKLPAPLAFEPANRWVDTSDWFPVNVDNDFSKPSEIGMEDWLEKPAGKRGWLRLDGDRIIHEDGTPFIAWGTNILRADNRQINQEYMIEAPRSAAHYGININRLHAFAKPHNDKWAHMFKLMDPEDSFKFHEQHLDWFDLIFAESKKHGIYTGWSVFYGWFPSQADIDEDRFMNWEEAQTMLRKGFPREGSFYASTAVMPDVQDLIIKWHVHLLNHVNPYTGLRYADDPALAFVELQNEENAFLGIRNLERILKDAPTYRQNYYNRFAEFLKEKYGDQDGLQSAWGGSLRANESLNEANITPFPVWYNASEPPQQRIADQYHFIYLTQQEYYLKFKKAIRETGYGGLLVGSCWQAADWVGHLYNTFLDSEVGMIDRHNYGRDHLDKPGTGLLSAGFQQLLNRPFNFSEWGGNGRVGQSIASPIMAIYGMGLQAWDGSQQFAWDHNGVLPHESTNINNSTNPFDNLAQYLTLSRLVLRGDVEAGDVAGLRRVSLPRLKETGWVGFHEEFSLLSNANNKSFNAAVPQESLAVGRVLMEFVDGPVDEPITDNTADYIDREARVVRSNTGQLLWDVSGKGWFSVNTPGTQAVIGNASEQPHVFEDVAFDSPSPYAHLYATALEKDADLRTGDRILITALGRAVPEGTKFDELAFTPLERPGNVREVPLLIEPVQATVTLKRGGKVSVTPLDQNGRKTPELAPLPVAPVGSGARFEIDTAATKSVYFLVEYE